MHGFTIEQLLNIKATLKNVQLTDTLAKTDILVGVEESINRTEIEQLLISNPFSSGKALVVDGFGFVTMSINYVAKKVEFYIELDKVGEADIELIGLPQ